MRSVLFIFSLIIWSQMSVFGQLTEVYTHEDRIYHQGIDLFEKEQYNASIVEFEKYLKEGDNGQKRTLSELYISISQLKLKKKTAASKLDDQLKRIPNTVLHNTAYFELGNYYFQEERFRQAARFFEEVNVSELSNEHWREAQFKIGYSLFKSDKPTEAKEYFELIKNQQGEYYVQANYFYGYICYTERDWQCALKHFDKIKGDGPKVMGLYIAQCYFALKNYKRSIEEIHTYQYSDKAGEFVLLEAKCLFKLEEYRKASRKFDEAEGYEVEKTADDYYMSAQARYLVKDYKNAYPVYLKISGRDDALGQLANYQMGLCFLNLDMKNKAFNAFSEAKRLNFNEEITENAHFTYAKLATELNKQNVAISSIDEFIKKYPESEYADAAKGLLAEIFLSTKNYKKAIEILEQIKNHNQQTRVAYQKVTFKRGEELYLNREYATANVMFEKSRNYVSDPLMEVESYFWQAEIAYKTGDYRKCISNYNRFLGNSTAKQSDYYTSCYYNMGYSYYMQKKYAQALNYFKKYRQTDAAFEGNEKRYIDNVLRLADCYFILNQYSQAREAYAYVSSKNTSESDYAIYQQAILSGLLNEPRKKIAILKKIPAAYPNSIYFDDALFEMGNTHLEMAEYRDARKYFELLIANEDRSPFRDDAYLKMGSLLFNEGQDQAAIETYLKVIDLYPKTESSQEALASLEIIYVQNGKGDEYLQLLQELGETAIRVTYQDSVMYESAFTLYRDGDCASATKGFQKYLDRFAESGYFSLDVHHFMAECQLVLGNKPEAAKHFAVVAEKATDARAENAAWRLARFYSANGEYEKSIGYFERLEKIAHSKDHYIEGIAGQMNAWFELQQWEKAKKKAIELLPVENVPIKDLVQANYILGRVQLMDDNLLTALFHFNFVIDNSPNKIGAESQYHKAQIFLKQGKLDSSRAAVFYLNDNFSPYEIWVVKGFILLSDVYSAEEDYFQARATLQSILDGYEGDAKLIEICEQKLKEIKRLEEGIPLEDEMEFQESDSSSLAPETGNSGESGTMDEEEEE